MATVVLVVYILCIVPLLLYIWVYIYGALGLCDHKVNIKEEMNVWMIRQELRHIYEFGFGWEWLTSFGSLISNRSNRLAFHWAIMLRRFSRSCILLLILLLFFEWSKTEVTTVEIECEDEEAPEDCGEECCWLLWLWLWLLTTDPFALPLAVEFTTVVEWSILDQCRLSKDEW